MTFRPVVVVAVVLAATASSSPWNIETEAHPCAVQATPPRDRPEGRATAVIRGRVTAAGTGQPLHRVHVRLNGPVADPPSAVTDTRGVFEITGVPAGSFSITVTRAGYLARQYGQRRPRQQGRSLVVEEGETIENVDVALPRGGVLAGRITDELGEASPGTRVEAVEFRYLGGRRIQVPAQIVTTNDEGDFRLSGLEPGTYQVRASARDVWQEDEGENTYTYAVSYYPGVTAADRPPAVDLAEGQQVTGLDFPLVVGRTARVRGVVYDALGAPLAGEQVHLSVIARTTGGALMSSGPGPTTRTDERGTFEFSKLAAGEYLAISGGPKDRTATTVIVGAGDDEHIVLALGPPASASGSIVAEDGGSPPFSSSLVRVVPVDTDAARVLAPWGAPRATSPKPDWTFQVGGMDSRYLFRLTGLPEGWMLKRVVLGGSDLTDTPLEIRTGGTGAERMQLVIGRGGGRVSGEVSDLEGNAAGATVIVFAEDAARWGIGSRFVRAVRPDSVGRFSVEGLPAGAYCAVASEAVIDGEWEDPQFLRRSLGHAVRFEVEEGDVASVKLVLEHQR